MSPGMAKVASIIGYRPFKPGFCYMGLVQRDPYARKPVRTRSEFALLGCRSDGVKDVATQELGRCVFSCELRHVVKIAIIQRCENLLEDVVGASDVDDDAIFGQ